MVLEEPGGSASRLGHGDRGPRQGDDVPHRSLSAGKECGGAWALSGRDATRADVAICLGPDPAALSVRSRGDRCESLKTLFKRTSSPRRAAVEILRGNLLRLDS